MNLKQKGFSLVEMMIAVSLAAILGIGGYSLYIYSKKNTDRISEDIHTAITRLGASSILKKDLSAAELSFNFLNITDDNGLPFFTLAKNQYCKHDECSRELTLSASEENKTSKPIYFILRKSYLNETQKLTVHPKSVFNGKNYAGINWQYDSAMYSLSRKHFPLTSWEEGRMMLVSSENDFYDCNLSSKSNKSSTCLIECNNPGKCDFSIKRPFRFLGVVAPTPSQDLTDLTIENSNSLLLRDYNVCRPNKDNGCANHIQANVTSSKTLYEKLPYIPGADDRTSIYHVNVVKYYLEYSDDKVHLYRSLGEVEGGRVKFGKGIKIMTGLKSIVFSRANVSNPSIEYRFITQSKRISKREVRL